MTHHKCNVNQNTQIQWYGDIVTSCLPSVLICIQSLSICLRLNFIHLIQNKCHSQNNICNHRSKNSTKYTTNKCKPNLKKINSCQGLSKGVDVCVHLEFELHIIQNPFIHSISHAIVSLPFFCVLKNEH